MVDVVRRLWRGLFLVAEDKPLADLTGPTGTLKKGTVVVGGGTGFIGKALCEELTKREVCLDQTTHFMAAIVSSRTLHFAISSTTSSLFLAPRAAVTLSPGKIWSVEGYPRTRGRWSIWPAEMCSIRCNGGTTLSKKL